MEKVWVFIIPVNAEESFFLSLTDIFKLIFGALCDWTELVVVLVRAHVMIDYFLEPLPIFLANHTEYPFYILRVVLEIVCSLAFQCNSYPKVFRVYVEDVFATELRLTDERADIGVGL